MNLGVSADRSGPRYPFQVLTAVRSGSGLSTSIANATRGLIYKQLIPFAVHIDDLDL